MSELDPRQRSGITRSAKTRHALLDTAAHIFAERVYSDVQVDDIARHAGRSKATFYNFFSTKGDWAAAVLDARLNEAMKQQASTEAGLHGTPHSRVLGHLGLLGAASAPLPGITQALVEERTTAQRSYTEILPGYYGELTSALQDGQELQAFRADMDASEMADFALDSLAMAYAVHLDSPASRTLPSMVLDGLATRT